MIKKSLMIALFLASFMHAKEITVLHNVSPNRVYVGDKINYQLQLIYPEKAKLVSIPSKKNMPFEVIDDQIQKEKINGNWHLTLDIQMTVYSVGELKIPSQTVKLSVQNKTKEITLPPIPIQWVSQIQTEEAKIKAIKPAWRIDYHWFGLMILCMGLMLGIMILGGLMYWRKKQKKLINQSQWQENAIRQDPSEVAIAQLNQLLTTTQSNPSINLMDQIDFLYDIMRAYLTARYGADTLHLTATELLHQMTPFLDEQTYKKLSKVVQTSDHIKFAKIAIKILEFEEIITKSKEIIIRTTPKIEEPLVEEKKNEV